MNILQVDTGGGAHIGGNVNVGGDFIGGREITTIYNWIKGEQRGSRVLVHGAYESEITFVNINENLRYFKFTLLCLDRVIMAGETPTIELAMRLVELYLNEV